MPDDGATPKRRLPLFRRALNRAFGGEAGGVFRGMAVLATGSAMAKLVGIAVMPILTRLYLPEHFGAMAVFTALVVMLSPFMTFRYVLSVPLPRHDGLAVNIMVLCAGLIALSGAALALILAFFSRPLLSLLSMEAVAPWWWLVVIALFGAGTYETLTLWATRKRAYKAIAQTEVTQSLAGTAVKLGFGILTPGPLGLMVGQIVAMSGGIGALLRAFGGTLRANLRHVRLSRLRKVAWRHRGFPIYRMPSQFLLAFSQQSPVIFVAAMFGGSTAGQLGLSFTVLALPVTLLGGSVGKALYGEAASIGIRHPDRLLRLVKVTQARLFAMALLPAAILFFFGADLFGFVFGESWRMAGLFASILSVYLVFQFSSAPLMQMMNLLDVQHVFLGINLVRACSLAALFLITQAAQLSTIVFVWSFAALGAAFYIYLSLWVVNRLARAGRSRDAGSPSDE